jgi:hypothetical protein
MPLCRTYSLVFDDLPEGTNSSTFSYPSQFHPSLVAQLCGPPPTSAVPVPPTSVGKPIIKNPTFMTTPSTIKHTIRGRNRSPFFHYSKYRSPKPEPSLYRKVLMSSLKRTPEGRLFLLKSTMNKRTALIGNADGEHRVSNGLTVDGE